MGLNNNEPGCPLAWWAVGFLGRAMGRGLFDDPYLCEYEREFVCVRERERKRDLLLWSRRREEKKKEKRKVKRAPVE